MEVKKRREDNMYNALAEIVYRMPLNEYRRNSKYGVSTSPVHSNVEWDKDSPNGRASEVRLESRTDFINTFLPKKPHGWRVSLSQPDDRVCLLPKGKIALYEKLFKFGF